MPLALCAEEEAYFDLYQWNLVFHMPRASLLARLPLGCFVE